MRIERWAGDDDAVRNCLEVWRAAKQADDPLGAPKSLTTLRAWMQHGFRGYEGEVWQASGDSDNADHGEGGTVAWYRLGLPNRGNTELADLDLWVHPDARRRGLGTRLLRHAAERAAANGRTTLTGMVPEGGAGAEFVTRAGAAPGLVMARRLLRVDEIPPGTLARLRAETSRHADGYTLVRWLGATPEEYVTQVAAVHEAMRDAPHDEGHVHQPWNAERVRQADAVGADLGTRNYSVAAMHDESDVMAAITQLFVDPENPDWAHQGMTAVTRPHRGHRLGLLTKTAMLEWVAETEPGLRRIDTGNADSNVRMIAVNDALGYELSGPAWVIYQVPVDKVKVTHSWT
jgi:GNAT superfamily N-acetyltransferase